MGQVGDAFRLGVHACRTLRTQIWDGRLSLSCPQSFYTSASLHSFARDQRTGWALGVLRVVWRWLLEFSDDHGGVCPDRSPLEEGLAKPPAGGLQPSLLLRVYFSLGQGHTLSCPIEAGAESWPRQRPLWDSLCHRNLPSSLRGGTRLCPACIIIWLFPPPGPFLPWVLTSNTLLAKLSPCQLLGDLTCNRLCPSGAVGREDLTWERLGWSSHLSSMVRWARSPVPRWLRKTTLRGMPTRA